MRNGSRILDWAMALSACGLGMQPMAASGAELTTPEERWSAVVSCASRSGERERHACVDEVLRQVGVLTEEQVVPDAMDAKIAAVAQGRDGKLWFTTVDGAVWQQTESKSFALAPQAGQTLTIHKAMLGSFICLVNGKSAFRCARSR
jgi:hypothetical protein